MRRVLLCTSFVLVLAASLIADSNLRITDVGLHGGWRSGPMTIPANENEITSGWSAIRSNPERKRHIITQPS